MLYRELLESLKRENGRVVWFNPTTGEFIQSRRESHGTLCFLHPTFFNMSELQMRRMWDRHDDDVSAFLNDLILTSKNVRISFGFSDGDKQCSIQARDHASTIIAAQWLNEQGAIDGTLSIETPSKQITLDDPLRIHTFLKFGISKNLVEAPIADFQYIDRSNAPTGPHPDTTSGDSFRPEDRKALTSPKWKAKVIHLFRKTNHDINVYAVNQKWLDIRDSREKALLGPLEIKANTSDIAMLDTWSGHYLPEDFKEMFGFLPPRWKDSINVVLMQNEGDERVPLTPWMLAHRIVHALGNRGRRGRLSQRYRIAFLTAFRFMGNAVFEIDLAHQDIHVDRSDIYAALATFASARNRKIIRPGEFIIEVFTQYLLTGEFDFNYQNLDEIDLSLSPESKERIRVALHEAKILFDECLEEAVGKLIVF